ncbi:hypothetical protein OHB00_15410 [Streptomyces sp. NBC_00631]|uniref:hypothetical protein n=1 Tax=Streptomyces sp. NBC_00631 TaxID=2975793 RepID=UPI0030E3E117
MKQHVQGRGRKILACICVPFALAGLTSCEPAPQFKIKNETTEGIHFEINRIPTKYDPASHLVQVAGARPGGDTGCNINRLGGRDGECHQNYQIVGTTQSGKKYTYGPPVCNGDTWTINGSTSP